MNIWDGIYILAEHGEYLQVIYRNTCSTNCTCIYILIWAVTWQNQQSECAPSEDSDQPGHPPSLIRVFAVRMKKPWALSYPLSALRRLWSDWADAQADLSLRCAHTHFVGFVMSRLIYTLHPTDIILSNKEYNNISSEKLNGTNLTLLTGTKFIHMKPKNR